MSSNANKVSVIAVLKPWPQTAHITDIFTS